MTDLFEDNTQPPIVVIKHAELYGYQQRTLTGELHIAKMKFVPGGYELQILWLNGRKLKRSET